MKVNERELLLTIEATLTEFLPLPNALELLPGVRMDGQQLGGWQHGQELSWRDAWAVMRHPDFWNGWLVVPLNGGRLVLAKIAAVEGHHGDAADLWRERTAGVLALLANDVGERTSGA